MQIDNANQFMNIISAHDRKQIESCRPHAGKSNIKRMVRMNMRESRRTERLAERLFSFTLLDQRQKRLG